jgi:hypothetical protein
MTAEVPFPHGFGQVRYFGAQFHGKALALRVAICLGIDPFAPIEHQPLTFSQAGRLQ